MSLDKMFQTIVDFRETISVDSVFGKPQEVEGQVLIPVASVSAAMGIGFDGEMPPPDETDLKKVGGRTGGGGKQRPVAMIQVTPQETVVKPIIDENKIALAGFALIGWCIFWLAAAVWAIFTKLEDEDE